MKKGLPEKARVAVSKYRKTAMMSAATALIVAAPAFADVRAADASLQATIRNILRTPAKEMSWRATGAATPVTQPRFRAISIDNGDDVTVGDDQSAISHAESVEDVSIVNSGNLTGGIGIEVSSGDINLADAVFEDSMTFDWNTDWQFIYDDAGNHLQPYGYYQSVPVSHYTMDIRQTILNTDPADSRISIDNSGSIAFSGLRGIKANNPAGESITITNSGDITSTQDIANRVGIYASTESVQNRYTKTLTAPGEFTYNAYGQLTGVVAPNEFALLNHSIDMELDGGIIDVHNTGDIDMGPADGYAGYGVMASVGIYTRGDGGTTIVNEGNIEVGEYSSGILTFANGNASITNAGRIEVGNASAGIFFEDSQGSADFYRLGGDVYILNTGDIVGGELKADTPPGEYTDVGGIRVFSLGSNNPIFATGAEINQLLTAYNQILGEDYFQLFDIPNTRLYTTTVVNQGRIELADGSRGIFIQPKAGDSIAINEGTIIVGEGTTNFRGNYHDPAAGIWNSNLPVDGRGLIVSINTATGIIHTGDDGAGLSSLNYRGDAFTINEGVITTGDGVVGQVEDYFTGLYDKLFHSQGMLSVSTDYVAGTTAYALNSGSITVGDLAMGSGVIGSGWSLLDPARITALNINEGTIDSGDNSAGMFTRGTNATSINTGTVTSGSYDISAYTTNQYSAEVFAMGRNGVGTSGTQRSEVINYGTITTGDGKVGASAMMSYDWGYGARILQNGDGIITTGDDSIGARVSGDDFALLSNAGRISVGDSSVGADITAGGALLYTGETEVAVTEGVLRVINDGLIETGDNSVGVRMNGDRKDVPWFGWMLVPSNYYPYYAYEQVNGTVDITSASYLQNSGTIRVGASSTAVEITGTPGSEQGDLHLLNAGSIEANQASSTAIRVNADNALGSYVVNLGTIAGNMTFGTGDDQLINTLVTDDNGRVTHSGNIVMNGSTIDFGAGNNLFANTRGMITLAGGDSLITGADLVMTQASIEARNNAVDSSLTINGNLSGDFAFGADFDSEGADQLIITGDVTDGSSMSLVLNPTRQLSGEMTFTVIRVGGENNGDAVIDGVTGSFADSLLGAQVNTSAATGDVNVTARFGMGHMATSASAATTMAQNWWMQSVGSFDKRNLQQLAGLEDAGMSAWATVFQEESSVDPVNDLQDVSFDQKLTGIQTGIEWQGRIGAGDFNIGPMFSYGNAAANQNANIASAMGDATAYGLNAGYRFSSGLYLNATWQQMAMEIDFRTPGTVSNAIGTTDAEGNGYNVELGYAHKLQSGLTFAPVLQYASVSMELDEFTTSDDVYDLSGMGGDHTLLRAGLSMFKTFETTNGSITPLVDLSYLDAMDANSALASNGILFDNDSSGSGYRAELGVAGRYKGWDIAGRVGFAETTAIKSALASNLTVRYRW